MNNMPVSQNGPLDLTRRDFVKNSSFAAAMLAMGGVPLLAADEKKETNFDANAILTKVRVGVIGCGTWGREILTALSTIPRAEVIALCDTYQAGLKRAKEAAPKAELYTDYKKVLENKDVQAVIIATPSHKHKDIALEAIAAGKHVYCEAPMATTIEDAKAIARAARDNPRSYFQVGQMYRCDKQHHFVLSFLRSGATGQAVMARAQWHKKTPWKRVAPNAQREAELNWRLDPEVSLGLIGEVGVQQIDAINWLMNKKPVAVSGFGTIAFHQDGRQVDDTAQAVFEYADGTFFTYDATIANSFDDDYEIVYGSDAAVMMRGARAWLFKETDSPLLGWEVYARKESFLNQTGIVLMMDASKSTSQTNISGTEAGGEAPIHYTLDHFVQNADLIGNAIEDYSGSGFDMKDAKALRDYIDKVSGKATFAGYQEGYEAAIACIKAAEAVKTKQRIKIERELYKI